MQLNNIWQKSFLRACAQLWLRMAATTETLHDDGHSDNDDDGDDDANDDSDDDNLVFRITCSVILPRAAGLNSSRASHHRGISY